MREKSEQGSETYILIAGRGRVPFISLSRQQSCLKERSGERKEKRILHACGKGRTQPVPFGRTLEKPREETGPAAHSFPE